MKQKAYDELVRCYKLFDKEPPPLKSSEQTFDDFKHGFRSGELTILQEERAIDDLSRAASALEGVANISRHWASEGGAPSAYALAACIRSASSIAESTRAAAGTFHQRVGRVLSETNRQALLDCRGVLKDADAALADVLARDDESREKSGNKESGDQPRVIRVHLNRQPQPAPTTGRAIRLKGLKPHA
jgi:hypothetical protein